MEDHWDPGSDSFGAVTPERGSFFSQTGGNDEATQAKVPAAQARAAASEAKKDSSIPVPSLSMDAPDITNSNPTPGSSRLSTSATVARPEYDDEERECRSGGWKKGLPYRVPRSTSITYSECTGGHWWVDQRDVGGTPKGHWWGTGGR